jgi:hypothetical protein
MVNLIPVCAAVVSCVCTALSAVTYEFGSDLGDRKDRLKTYTVSWSFTKLGGEGPLGVSPLLVLLWTVTWFLCGFWFPLYTLILGLADDYQLPSEDAVLNSASFLGAGLVVGGAWSFLFTLRTPTSTWAAAAVITLGAALALTAVGIYRPFLREVWHISVCVGVPYEFAAGWLCVKAAQTITTAVRITDHGGIRSDMDLEQPPPPNFGPLVIASTLAVLALVLGAPVLPIPFVIAMFFVRNSPWHWGALAVALLGVGLGVLHVASGLNLY